MNENDKENNHYSEEQFCRYMSIVMYKKICDLENALNFIYDGKFFDAERKIKGARDSFLNLRSQCETRLKNISKNDKASS